MNKYMDLKTNWSIFSKNRSSIYGVAIISIIIYHYFEDVAALNLTGGELRQICQLYNTFISSVGVEFFVFLSGVGLYFSMEKDSNTLRFFTKRAKRILPAYLMVAVPYWVLVDFLIMRKGPLSFVLDLCFVTFFTQGIRTFWYVPFIILAYLSYPLVYKLLHTNWTNQCQAVMLIFLALSIQLIPKYATPSLNQNIEILLGRFLIFFIGCWCGKKVYWQEYISDREKVGIFLGVGLMLCQFVPVIKRIVLKLGFRLLMCFWGIFLLYCMAVCMPKVPKKIIKVLDNFGVVSYELYLTHVAVRALMNIVGLRTFYLQNYVLCVLISLLLTATIVNLQRRMVYAS